MNFRYEDKRKHPEASRWGVHTKDQESEWLWTFQKQYWKWEVSGNTLYSPRENDLHWRRKILSDQGFVKSTSHTHAFLRCYWEYAPPNNELNQQWRRYRIQAQDSNIKLGVKKEAAGEMPQEVICPDQKRSEGDISPEMNLARVLHVLEIPETKLEH